MARDAVALTALAVNAATEEGAGVAINPANGDTIANAGQHRRLVLRVYNSAAGPKNVTLKAGVNPPAFRAELGDLVVAVTNAKTVMIPIESARFAQADGTILVDFEAGMTGTVWAYKMPGDSS